jgi:4-hydroxyphenylpyruvate dioxygenase-like putative hemolysin
MMKEDEDTIKLGDVIQIGVVVKDVDLSVEYYSKNFGIGPWRILVVERPSTNTTVYGEAASYKAKIGIARVSPTLTLELVQDLEGETIRTGFLKEKGEGINHLMFAPIDDIKKEIGKFEKKGFKVIQSSITPEGGFAYIDTTKIGGIVFEIAQRRKT